MRTGANVSYGPRALALGEWLAVTLLTWRLIAWIAVPEHRTQQPDFVSYFYVAGWRLAHGLNPYDFVSRWGNSFYNPPWFALLLVPFSFLSLETASLCSLALSLGLPATLSAVPVSRWATAPVALVSRVVMSLDSRFHRWIELEGERIWLRSRLGEQPVAWLWEQSQWNWRFIAMLLPASRCFC